jgi:hypothetical protein
VSEVVRFVDEHSKWWPPLPVLAAVLVYGVVLGLMRLIRKRGGE